jgi:hypothetical protein
MPSETAVTAVAHVIQLAVAPVFLLSGIGAMMAVLTARLSRIVDRARVLEARAPGKRPDFTEANEHSQELITLSRRAKTISRAIGLCTLTALLICAVIAVLFVGAFVGIDTSAAVVMCFVLAMLTLILALILFLREILLATKGLRFGTG